MYIFTRYLYFDTSLRTLQNKAHAQITLQDTDKIIYSGTGSIGLCNSVLIDQSSWSVSKAPNLVTENIRNRKTHVF